VYGATALSRRNERDELCPPGDPRPPCYSEQAVDDDRQGRTDRTIAIAAGIAGGAALVLGAILVLGPGMPSSTRSKPPQTSLGGASPFLLRGVW
jgi:hypothetical protein